MRLLVTKRTLSVVCLWGALQVACQTGQGGSGNAQADGQDGSTSGTGSTAQAATGDGNHAASGGGNTAGAGNSNTAGTGSAAPRFIGRVDDTNLLTWPGTAVEAAFHGTKGSATFTVKSGTTYLSVSVDGATATKVLVQDKVPVAFGPVAQGNHVVRLTKLNESELGTIQFVGLTTDGSLLVPTAPSRRLEFIGDSITVGYGVEGTRPCTNSSAMENVQKAWSGLTGTGLQADVSVIAWSGHGLLRNGMGVADNNTLPTLWTRTNANDLQASYTFPAASVPDAVIINLGTNDFIYTSGSDSRAPLDLTSFTSTYVSFVQAIRSKYPKATVVLATSPMLSDSYPSATDAQFSSLLKAITSVQTQLGDPNIQLLNIATMDTTVSACDYHPSAAEQQLMASQLITELKAQLGW